ncbi:MAG: hypothetical protein LBU55_01260 [Elusimicrobiota bacterium]|jgi:hypothetical protein|nr:hypothetical protein [Elusimicrobiota bacterium]
MKRKRKWKKKKHAKISDANSYNTKEPEVLPANIIDDITLEKDDDDKEKRLLAIGYRKLAKSTVEELQVRRLKKMNDLNLTKLAMVAVDKYLSLTGKPTSITAHMTLGREEMLRKLRIGPHQVTVGKEKEPLRTKEKVVKALLDM